MKSLRFLADWDWEVPSRQNATRLVENFIDDNEAPRYRTICLAFSLGPTGKIMGCSESCTHW